jgi:hypothetical protein
MVNWPKLKNLVWWYVYHIAWFQHCKFNLLEWRLRHVTGSWPQAPCRRAPDNAAHWPVRSSAPARARNRSLVSARTWPQGNVDPRLWKSAHKQPAGCSDPPAPAPYELRRCYPMARQRHFLLDTLSPPSTTSSEPSCRWCALDWWGTEVCFASCFIDGSYGPLPWCSLGAGAGSCSCWACEGLGLLLW